MLYLDLQIAGVPLAKSSSGVGIKPPSRSAGIGMSPPNEKPPPMGLYSSGVFSARMSAFVRASRVSILARSSECQPSLCNPTHQQRIGIHPGLLLTLLTN